MIGKIVESIRVNPGTASQYEPGDVGAVDSQNLQREQISSVFGEKFYSARYTCKIAEVQPRQSAMSRTSNLGLFFRTGLRMSSVSQLQFCKTKLLRFVDNWEILWKFRSERVKGAITFKSLLTTKNESRMTLKVMEVWCSDNLQLNNRE